MFNHKAAKETTDTILEKLQKSPAENIVAHIGEARYLVPTATLKLNLWNAIPDFVKDEKSEKAREMATFRLGLKALLRPIMPLILRKTWEQDVDIVPGLNILTWLPTYFVHYLVAFMSAKEWQIHVEKCESCEGDVYKIVGISPHANNPGDTPGLATASADSQPVPGGE